MTFIIRIHVLMYLIITKRIDPECEPHLDEALNQEINHSS